MFIVVGQGDENWQDEKVSSNDNLGFVASILVVKVEDVGDPGQKAKCDHIPQGGGDGRGDVVGVAPALPGRDDDDHHDHGQGEAREAGRDDGTGAQQQGLLVVGLPHRYPAHCEATERGQEANHDTLTLDQDQVADHRGQGHLAVVQMAEVGRRGQSGRQGHLEVPLEAEQRRDHDDDLWHHDEGGPVLDVVQQEPRPDHATARHQVGGEDLEDDLPPFVIGTSATLHLVSPAVMQWSEVVCSGSALFYQPAVRTMH